MKKKILIINDNESIREIIQFYLEMKDYEVFQAENGNEGLKKSNEVLPNLILLDVMMPDMNGYEVCRLLKQNPKTQEIPVLFLSSLSNSSDKIEGLASGGVDFINNTTDQTEILARIETHLKIQELTKELQASNKELTLKQKALNEDLQAAGIIQKSLLPTKIPSIPNLQLDWFCHPCALVGGDICNITPINPEQLNLYILDVSGHGVPSAMITVSITQYLEQRELIHSSFSPKQVLMSLNKEYPFEKFNMFSTIFYMTVNPQNGKLIYSNAGHPAAVFLNRHGKFKLLDVTGPLIGIEQDANYEELTENLQEGDKVILYTDGIIEFRNAQGEFYGSDRFYELLETIKEHSINKIIQLVSESLLEFGKGIVPQDDMSLLGIEFKKSIDLV